MFHEPRVAKNNRQWLGWKPSVTPITPPPRRVHLEQKQANEFFSQPQVPTQHPTQGIDHAEFCRNMNGAPLPHDSEERKNFDIQETSVLGDPAASFDRPSEHEYECKYDDPYQGFPVWNKIFAHILRHCGYLEDYDTIYMLVDTRNLAEHQIHNSGLPHWPAAAAWWERLDDVENSWAGTFVLAALGASFPGKHFFLVDSDCLPVTLFEAFDLWQEAFLTRFPLGADEPHKAPHPLRVNQRFEEDPSVKDTREGTSHQNIGQGVLLVTEPHAELNAGFVALFASSHAAIFDWTQWNTDTKYLSEGELERRCAATAVTITEAFWKMVEQYLRRQLLPHELSPEARKAWLQTGLALSPLFCTVAQHSIDVIVAWALIGEWSSRVLFPPPKGQWPRHGLMIAMVSDPMIR